MFCQTNNACLIYLDHLAFHYSPVKIFLKNMSVLLTGEYTSLLYCNIILNFASYFNCHTRLETVVVSVLWWDCCQQSLEWLTLINTG